MEQWEYCSIGDSTHIDGKVRAYLMTLEGAKVIYTSHQTGESSFHETYAWVGLQGWEVCSFDERGLPVYFKRSKRS